MGKFALIKSIFSKVKSLQALLPPPLREILSEPNGTGSYSRTVGFLIVAFTLFWTTYLVFKNRAFPDMTGPTLFIGGGAGSQYGLNQIQHWKKTTELTVAPDASLPTSTPTGAPDATQP